MKKALAIILAVLMLCSVVVIATSAEEDAIDWEGFYKKYGLNVYIGAPTETPPVLDGTISTGEYTFAREIPYADLFETAANEIQSSLKEYFAHDAEYIYIGAQFEQKNDNRAYWIQWKATNTFDVFRDSTVRSQYYYDRVNTQIRYQEDGTTTDTGFGESTSGYRFPTVGQDEDAEYRYAAAKVVDEANSIYTKTIEVRISKVYIAEVAGCAVADVRVMPYWTYFHANLQNAAPLTTDFVVELSELDFSTFIPSDRSTYWFLVCDEAPEGYIPGQAEATTPPTTDGSAPATTTAATTSAATTTAAATTAAATTAATTAAEEGGCKGSIAITALAVLPTLAGGALLLKRKKED